MRWHKFPGLLCATFALLLVALASAFVPVRDPVAGAGIGSVDVLEARYLAWVRQYEARGGNRRMELSLGPATGLMRGPRHDLTGVARVDLSTGAVQIEVRGSSVAPALEAWLVSNRPDGSVAPESGDRFVRLGALAPRHGVLKLHVDSEWRDRTMRSPTSIDSQRSSRTNPPSLRQSSQRKSSPERSCSLGIRNSVATASES